MSRQLSEALWETAFDDDHGGSIAFSNYATLNLNCSHNYNDFHLPYHYQTF